MSSKNMSLIFKILFQTGDINIFVLCGVFFSRYVQLKRQKKHRRSNLRQTLVEKLSKMKFCFFEFKVRTSSFAKERKGKWSIAFFTKMFLFYDDRIEVTCKNQSIFQVFVFPGLRPWRWPRPPICIYRPWPPICFTGSGPQFVFTSPGPQFVITGPGSQFVFNSSGLEFCILTVARNFGLAPLAPNLYLQAWPLICYLSVQVKIFTASTTAICTITTTTITTTTTTAIRTNRDNNNKRCLRGSKIHIKWPLKDIWWKSQVLFQ